MEHMQYAPQHFQRVGASDDNFNKWFLDNKEGISNLRYTWRGWERDINGDWFEPKDSAEKRVMNEKGIHWAVGVMESYLDRVFQQTNWDEEHMNFEMRKAYRVVWFGLAYNFKKFCLSKINVQTVANKILSRIDAIMLSARGEGIRKYLGSSQQIQEIRQSNTNDGQRGFFNSISSLFGRNQ